MPTGVGNVAAQVVLDFRHRDGANQLGDEPGGIPRRPLLHDLSTWQPLRYVDGSGNPVTQGFVGAQWQQVATFALSPARYGEPA
jgi:hypothetical protein